MRYAAREPLHGPDSTGLGRTRIQRRFRAERARGSATWARLRTRRNEQRVDGTANTLSAVIAAGDALTVVLVARARAISGIFASGTGVSINPTTTGVLFTGGGSTTATNTTLKQWRVIAATADGTTDTVTVDGATASASMTGVFGNVLRLAANGTPANFSQLDVLEVISYPTALNAAALASVRAALKIRYGSILL